MRRASAGGRRRVVASASAVFVVALGLGWSLERGEVRAFATGPPASHTGAPGEPNCTSCHSSFNIEAGAGRVRVGGLPAHYAPGQAIPLTVTTSQLDGLAYGFQVTALTAAGEEAGTLTLTDTTSTQLVTGVVGMTVRSYVEHTFAGIAPVEFNRRVWAFQWTAPATDVGPVTFYTAGNGANANNEPTGDYVYTSRAIIGCTGTAPARLHVPPTGGPATLTVLSACAWTATSNDPWIVITSPPTGSGNGSVTLSIDPNPNPVRRAGSIAIGGIDVPVLQGQSFSDVPVSDPFFDFVAKVSAAGLTGGCGGEAFCPADPTTRGQGAVFVVAGLGETSPPQLGITEFVDVPPTHPFYRFVNRAGVLGLSAGCGNANYCPDAPWSRGQAAVFIVRALHDPGYSPPAPATQRFADVPLSDPFAPYVDELAARGITAGCGGGNFCPNTPLTRAQTAVFLVRAFGL